MITDITRGMLLLRRGRKRVLSRASPIAPVPQHHELVLGHTSTGQPVFWPLPSTQAASHCVCLAASGTGKTVALGNALLMEFIRQFTPGFVGVPSSLVVCDPKGDLVEVILQGLSALAPELLATNVGYLCPFTHGGFGFNLNLLDLGNTPIDIRALQLADLVGSVSTGSTLKHLTVGSRQRDAFLHLILGALDTSHPQSNILWALDALVIPNGLKRLAAITRSQRAKMFLQSTRLSDELRASTASRLRTAFAATSDLERLVTANTSIQFGPLLASGQLTCIDLSSPVGGLEILQEFWASLLVRMVLDDLGARKSPWNGHHCRVAIDEAQVVAGVLSDTAERVLTQGRSKGQSLVIASQGSTLIHDASKTLLPVLLTNTPTKLIGRLAAQDAELLARSQSPGPGIDESLSATRQRFVGSVTNLPDREFYRLTPGQRERFRSADLDLEGWAVAAEQRASELEQVKARLAVPRSSTPRVTLADVSSHRKKRKPATKKTVVHEQPETTRKPVRPKRSKWG